MGLEPLAQVSFGWHFERNISQKCTQLWCYCQRGGCVAGFPIMNGGLIHPKSSGNLLLGQLQVKPLFSEVISQCFQ